MERRFPAGSAENSVRWCDEIQVTSGASKVRLNIPTSEATRLLQLYLASYSPIPWAGFGPDSLTVGEPVSRRFCTALSDLATDRRQATVRSLDRCTGRLRRDVRATGASICETEEQRWASFGGKTTCEVLAAAYRDCPGGHPTCSTRGRVKVLHSSQVANRSCPPPIN